MEHIMQNKNKKIVSVYKSMYTGLFKYGCRLTGDHALVEDCINDLFAELIHKDDFSDIKNWGIYLTRALKNKLLNELERRKPTESIDEMRYEYTFERSSEDIMIEEEEMKLVNEKVQKTIERLSKRNKEVINLRFYDGLSFDKIGVRLGIKSKTVQNHIQNAYIKFRHIYSSL